MDCISPMQNKRRHSGELEQGHNQSKRLCNGLGGCGRVEYGAVMETQMDTWDAQNHSPQNGHSASVPGMGHINHIKRY
ncbi:hypothetical protein cypCar_00047792 [Cyprinus carpio]|nr:hypothetical protein cypCar_00047792 [Cyprinus carpio]